MRISDWSSDVCSSDLAAGVVAVAQRRVVTIAFGRLPVAGDRRVFLLPRGRLLAFASCGLLRLPGVRRLGRQAQIRRAWCRVRVCEDGLSSVVAVSVKKKNDRQ